MALPVLPIPIGVSFPMRKTPRFNVVTQQPTNGQRPVSFSTQLYPIWEFELTFDHIRDQGLQNENTLTLQKPDFFALQDFYLAIGGSNARFIFDPYALPVPLDDTYVPYQTTGTLVNGYSGTQISNNYLLFSQNQNDSAIWTQTDIASVSGPVAAPDFGLSAWTLTSTNPSTGARIQQSSRNPAATGYELTFSVYLKVASGTAVAGIGLGDSTSGVTGVACNLTTTWQRFSVTRVLAASGPFVIINVPDNGGSIEVAWAQLESGSTANTYLATQFTDAIPAVAFQLFRASSITGMLQQVEPIDCLSFGTSAAIYLNGALQSSGYAVSQFPLVVTFTSPPSAGTDISWQGAFAYVCQFSDDSIDFNENYQQVWDLQSLKLSQVPLS